MCNEGETLLNLETEEIERAQDALTVSWGIDTTVDPENWSEDNPAHGQCVPTALVIQDLFGGKIVWAMVIQNGQKVSHYFNELPDGTRRDFTEPQFSKEEHFDLAIGGPRQEGMLNRDYLLPSENTSQTKTAERYELLRTRVLATLGIEGINP